MKKFISFSGGVESTTMCVLFGKDADAIFADTGFEHDVIYKRLDLVESFCKNLWGDTFNLIKVKNEKHESLPEYIRQSRFYPSFQSRFCTRMFKIEPIDNYLSQYKDEGIQLMIGLNAEEKGRAGNHGNKSFIDYSYPLMVNNINRSGCIDILKRVEMMPKFPPYMKRGGCVGCYYKSKKEYEAMALLNPYEFSIVENLETAIQQERPEHESRDKYFSILPDITMKQIRERVNNMLFKPDEIYPVTNDATKCGVFCNR